MLPRKELKVTGGSVQEDSSKKKGLAKTEEPLTQKLVSNVPGEEKIWKYPSLDLLSDTQAGKADRGDIKGNAATIEQTLESFGITPYVVDATSVQFHAKILISSLLPRSLEIVVSFFWLVSVNTLTESLTHSGSLNCSAFIVPSSFRLLGTHP